MTIEGEPNKNKLWAHLTEFVNDHLWESDEYRVWCVDCYVDQGEEHEPECIVNVLKQLNPNT